MSANPVEVVDPAEFIDVLDYQFAGNSVTIDNKRRVIQAYRERGTIAHAAQSAGISRKSVYHYLNNDPVFAEAMEDAHQDTVDVLDSSVYERAMKSDLLAMFWLKAHRPIYRDRVTLDLQALKGEMQARLSAVQPTLSTLPNAPLALSAKKDDDSGQC